MCSITNSALEATFAPSHSSVVPRRLVLLLAPNSSLALCCVALLGYTARKHRGACNQRGEWAKCFYATARQPSDS